MTSTNLLTRLFPQDLLSSTFQQEGRVIAVHAKRARGLMARCITEIDIVDLESFLFSLHAHVNIPMASVQWFHMILLLANF